MPSDREQSAGHAHSEQVFKTSSSAVGLQRDTPWTLNATMRNSRRFLNRLRLGPRRHPKAQHLSQRPHMVRQACRHRRRTGRHTLAEPVPWVGIGAASAWRKLTCGNTKLW